MTWVPCWLHNIKWFFLVCDDFFWLLMTHFCTECKYQYKWLVLDFNGSFWCWLILVWYENFIVKWHMWVHNGVWKFILTDNGVETIMNQIKPFYTCIPILHLNKLSSIKTSHQNPFQMKMSHFTLTFPFNMSYYQPKEATKTFSPPSNFFYIAVTTHRKWN